MNDQKTPKSFGTHDGIFHADEVTACALLLLFGFIEKDKIIRDRDPESLKKCEFLCDVGREYNPERKLFDHHQFEYQGKLSSAGMILLYLKDQHVISEKEYVYFRDSLVEGVDAIDNGLHSKVPGHCTYSDVITNYNPIDYDPIATEQEKAFEEALDFAYNHLKRLWARFQYIRSCKSVVENEMKKNGKCLFFENAVPWQELFFELGGAGHPALFVIMPSGKQWILRGIPPSMDDILRVRVPQPMSWAGLFDEELKKVSGICGAVFCHKGLFISVWETKEDAIKAMEASIG